MMSKNKVGVFFYEMSPHIKDHKSASSLNYNYYKLDLKTTIVFSLRLVSLCPHSSPQMFYLIR